MDLQNDKNCFNSMENCNNSVDLTAQIHYESDVHSLYYGVHLPSDTQMQDMDNYVSVFKDKAEALKMVKKYKKARFKAFTYYHEAESFAVHGSEWPNNNTAFDGSLFGKPSTDSPMVGEKPSQFRGPKSQDLVKLRKGIESCDLQFVTTTIWENPRYLVSVGDTPSILQVSDSMKMFVF